MSPSPKAIASTSIRTASMSSAAHRITQRLRQGLGIQHHGGGSALFGRNPGLRKTSLDDRLCRARRPPTDSREKASFGQQLAQHSRGACLSAVLLNVHLHCSRELVDAGSQGRTVRSAAMISPVSQGEWSDPRCRCREMPSILDRCGCLDRLGRLTAACECSDEGS